MKSCRHIIYFELLSRYTVMAGGWGGGSGGTGGTGSRL